MDQEKGVELIPIWFTFALSLASIFGGVINARGRIEGFYVWLLTSGAWGALCILDQSMLGQLPMWLAYLAISAYGIKMWKKDAAPNI